MLFKKERTFVDEKTGKEKTVENFYVQCGDQYIPIQVCYFGKEDKIDYNFRSRRAILSAFAQPFPSKDEESSVAVNE